MKRLKFTQRGFTIIELLIATVIFSVVLLLCTTGILQVTKLYYKGIATVRTQEASRNILEEISRTIQYSGGKVVPTSGGPATYYFCVGSKRYSYVLNKKLIDSPPLTGDTSYHVLVYDTDTLCTSAKNLAPLVLAAPPATELMYPEMRLSELRIENIPSGSNLFKITVRVLSGDGTDIDATDPNNVKCKSTAANMFCAVSELSTTVQKRI